VLRRGSDDAGMLNSLAWFTAINDIYLSQALEAAKKAVELEPENSNILDTLAEVYFRLGNAEKAIEIETRALELSPDETYLKEQLARFRGEGSP
jgi:tetratricopeptide (TPR) repeat protein